MTLLVILTLGAALGWVAAVVLRHDSLRQSFTDISVGAVGAIGGYLASGNPLESRAIDVDSLLLCIAGAAIMVAVAALLRHQIIR